MTARDNILSAIRAQQVKRAPRPTPYRPPASPEDLMTDFCAQATRAASEVRRLGSLREVPAAVAEALRSRNMKAAIHLPADAPFSGLLPWDLAPGLTVEHGLPGPDDAAIAVAPYGIAETGTVVFPAARDQPASWHFRPGLEFAVVRAGDILADLEAVLVRLKQASSWPATINLITGPSRTGDIEQTLELGAHGPKELIVLVVES